MSKLIISLKSTSANKDGSYSPDEESREKQLRARVRKFAADVKDEAYEIGGEFRGPGIVARMSKEFAAAISK